MDEKLKQLRRDYENTPIPTQLQERVQAALKKRRHRPRWSGITAAALAACLVVFMVALNISPAFAKRAAKLPIIGTMARVLTWREYWAGDNNMELNVRVPQVSGLMDEELQVKLNQEFNEAADAIIGQFDADVQSLKAKYGDDFDGHVSQGMDYEVFTNNDDILSLALTNMFTGASATVNYRCYTVDKKSGDLVSFDTMFLPDSNWREVISNDILRQMREQMARDENQFYWVEPGDIAPFEQIRSDQQFYVNNDGKLVILFDKYEVAPGYMGNPLFVIDTQLLAPVLQPDAPLR